MLSVFSSTWALLIGMFLLQIGNGLQGTALGLRGGIEEFDTTLMGVVMTGYFVGFLFGAKMTPIMLRRVGHVRTFAAMASLLSAAFILYAVAVDPWAWTAMRVLSGFCFSAVYVVAESWLNNQSTNENRGQAMSIYLVCQMGGIVLSQAIVPLGDPAGYDLFVVMTVAVSLACTPILLSASPAPVAEADKQLPLSRLFEVSPLGAFGMLVSGAIFAGMFGMTPVWGVEVGLTAAELSILIGSIYTGALVLQFPIGYISDRVDRRHLIAIVAALGGAGCVLMSFASGSFPIIVAGAVLLGGCSNPLYSLLVAHTNDFMEHEEMAGAAGGLVLLTGVGAAGTPFIIGYLMDIFGVGAFPIFLTLCFALITGYALYRMTVRPATPVEETLPYTVVTPIATPVTYETAQAVYAEAAEAQAAEMAEIEMLDFANTVDEHGWGDEGERVPSRPGAATP
ncbi:MAG: MFS transporter [Pseudomonadota bacterium]